MTVVRAVGVLKIENIAGERVHVDVIVDAPRLKRRASQRRDQLLRREAGGRHGAGGEAGHVVGLVRLCEDTIGIERDDDGMGSRRSKPAAEMPIPRFRKRIARAKRAVTASLNVTVNVTLLEFVSAAAGVVRTMETADG